VVPIPSLRTRPLRQRVLRPHQRVEDLFFDGDDDVATMHFGAFLNVDSPGALPVQEPIGIASMYNKPAPEKWAAAGRGITGPAAWQLRGMATSPEHRGTGAGGLLLQACLAWAREHQGSIFWCNARVGVRGFYERYGLAVHGEPYDMPGIGPHVFMWLPL